MFRRCVPNHVIQGIGSASTVSLDQYRMLVFGLAMVLLMIWRPRGLIGHRAPTVYLERNQAISSDLVKEGHG